MHKGQKGDGLVHRIDGGERLLDSGTELSGKKTLRSTRLRWELI